MLLLLLILFTCSKKFLFKAEALAEAQAAAEAERLEKIRLAIEKHAQVDFIFDNQNLNKLINIIPIHVLSIYNM